MADTPELETEFFSVAWKTEKPTPDRNIVTSPSFCLLGLKCKLRMVCIPSRHSDRFAVYLHLLDGPQRLERQLRVRTFVEHEKVRPQRLLSSFKVVAYSNQYIWTYTEQEITRLAPDFLNCEQLKVVCLFHDVPVPVLQLGNETEHKTSQTDAELSHGCISNSRNPEGGQLSSEKSTQASLDLSPDLESLSFDLSNLLEKGVLPDVQLKCGVRLISAHRVVLSARSEVFAAMFRTEMVESEKGIVEIADMSAPDFEIFLKYLYTGVIHSLPDDSVSSLYAAGDKYAVRALKRLCSKRMVEGLTEQNCLEFLVLADAHCDQDFKDSVTHFVIEHMEAVLKNEAWSMFNKQHTSLAIDVYQVIVQQKCFGATSGQCNSKK